MSDTEQPLDPVKMEVEIDEDEEEAYNKEAIKSKKREVLEEEVSSIKKRAAKT